MLYIVKFSISFIHWLESIATIIDACLLLVEFVFTL